MTTVAGRPRQADLYLLAGRGAARRVLTCVTGISVHIPVNRATNGLAGFRYRLLRRTPLDEPAVP